MKADAAWQSVRWLTKPLVANNPVAVQMLGICSALAVTTSLTTATTMCLALTFVLCGSSVIISAARNYIPDSTRLIIQITIIASLVIVVDLILQAYLFEISQQLTVFISLIVTNCLVLARAESYAMHQRVWPSLLDALGNSAGYSLLLLLVALPRELLGLGTVYGKPVLISIESGGWFEPLDVMLRAPTAFFIIGLLVWLGNTFVQRTSAQHNRGSNDQIGKTPAKSSSQAKGAS